LTALSVNAAKGRSASVSKGLRVGCGDKRCPAAAGEVLVFAACEA
jgi:hypothetical protein